LRTLALRRRAALFAQSWRSTAVCGVHYAWSYYLWQGEFGYHRSDKPHESVRMRHSCRSGSRGTSRQSLARPQGQTQGDPGQPALLQLPGRRGARNTPWVRPYGALCRRPSAATLATGNLDNLGILIAIDRPQGNYSFRPNSFPIWPELNSWFIVQVLRDPEDAAHDLAVIS
jgi:hypothetical protein